MNRRLILTTSGLLSVGLTGLLPATPPQEPHAFRDQQAHRSSPL